MNLKGSQTHNNLLAAFQGESAARNRYTCFAVAARKEGHEDVAALFDRMAENEKEHAKVWFNLVRGGMGTTVENLIESANGENSEWRSMYPRFAEQAKEEGFDLIAQMFSKVAEIEKDHEKTFLQELVKLKSGKVEAPVEEADENANKTKYRCVFCGSVEYVEGGKEPSTVCPVCQAIGAFQKA